jgi:hypothetical protein
MKNKGSDALVLIVCLPCIAFILVMTLLGIIKPVMAMLADSVYHTSNSIPFQSLPLKPSLDPTASPKTERLLIRVDY